MANRYWVGGAGTWNATSTTHWSATSGGASGASVPTAADNVFFNSASNATSYAVTISPIFTGTGDYATVTSMTSVVTIVTVTTGTVAVGDIISLGQFLFKITSFGTGTGGAGTYNCNVLYGTGGYSFGTGALTASRQVCADINIAGPAAGTLTWTTTTGSLVEVAGSITTSATGASAPDFIITTTGTASHTITSNGLSLTSADIYLSGTGTYTLGGALTCAYLYTSFGTFTTANFALTVYGFDQRSSGTRTINLGSSTVTVILGGYPLGPITNWGGSATLNAGTSTVNFAGNYAFFVPFGSKTWYNVTFTATNIADIPYGIPIGTSGETNTFNNLSIAGQSTTGCPPIWIDATSTTINGTFTIGAATSATCRLSFKTGNYTGATFGTSRTITAAAFAAGATDVDWQDIVIAGAAGTISGTRFGNCGGCTNITFGVAKTVYWNGVTGGSWTDNKWATISGGSVAAANFPLAQDTAVLDNTGLNTGQSISIDNVNIGTINAGGLTKATTISYGTTNSSSIVGNLNLSSSVTVSGTTGAILTFYGPTTQTITSSATITTPCFSIYNNLQLLSAVTTAADFWNCFALYRGTLDLNGYVLTTPFFYSSGTDTRTINLNSGSMVISGLDYESIYYAFDCSTSTNLTVTGTGTITLTNASAKTFQGGSKSWGTLVQAGAGALTITGSNTFADLQATAGGRPSTILFTAGTTSTFTMFTLAGTAGNLVTVGSDTAASHTLSKSSGYVLASYLSISYSTATGGAAWYAPPSTNTNGGNNTGWLFTAPPPPVSIGTGIKIGGGITIG